MPEHPYEWPEGYACALSLTVDVDAVTPMMWRLRHIKQYPVAEQEMRRFGLRQGVERILDLLSSVGMQATFFVPGYIAEKNPGIPREIIAAGHEIGLHGYLHEDVESMDEEANRDVLARSISTIERISGVRHVGYRSPSWSMTAFLPNLLREKHLQYDSSLMGYDHPYTFEGVTELPVTWTADDATYFFYLGPGDVIAPPWPVDQVERAWREEIASAKRFGGYVCLTIHPWLSGRGHRALALERLLSEAKADTSIWIAPCREVAAYHEASPNRKRFEAELSDPGMALNSVRDATT
jgi:peptidoglycan/xylan/chitin deacetylase (PgdA/CDA1 family)